MRTNWIHIPGCCVYRILSITITLKASKVKILYEPNYIPLLFVSQENGVFLSIIVIEGIGCP